MLSQFWGNLLSTLTPEMLKQGLTHGCNSSLWTCLLVVFSCALPKQRCDGGKSPKENSPSKNFFFATVHLWLKNQKFFSHPQLNSLRATDFTRKLAPEPNCGLLSVWVISSGWGKLKGMNAFQLNCVLSCMRWRNIALKVCELVLLRNVFPQSPVFK